MRDRFFFYLSVYCLLFSVLFASLFFVTYNPLFYHWQYSANGIYENFGFEETWEYTGSLWMFMIYGSDTLHDAYSAQDYLHMLDVRFLLFLCWAGLLLCVLVPLFSLRSLHSFVGLFRSTSIGIFSSSAIFVLLALFFERSFIWFHYLFFTNDLWMMDPRYDLLVQLYPTSFFHTAFISIVFSYVLCGLLFFVLSFVLTKRHIN